MLSTELTQKENRRLKRIATLADNPDNGVLIELNDLEDRIDTVDEKADKAISIAEETQKMAGPKGDSPTPEEIKAIVEPLIPAPIPGKDYVLTENDKEEIAGKIKPIVVEKVIERTEVIKEQPIVTEVVKEVAMHETALETADKLNKENEIVEQSVIIGLLEEFKKLEEQIANNKGRVVGGVRKTKFSAYSLTSQCNGVTKTFTLPIKTMSVLGVFGTQWPVQFDPSNDFTFSGRTLTLGVSLSAPETSQTLWVLIETL